MVVLTGRPLSEQVAVNEYCHKNGVKFISADIHGLFASVFVDLGEEVCYLASAHSRFSLNIAAFCRIDSTW